MTTRTTRERVEGVRRLVNAARELSRDEALIEPLMTSTGLSRPGVLLALREHLEIAPTDEELERLVDRSGTAERVHVILSSNVFVGALRALAVARAAAPRVVAVPSRRDPIFAHALVRAASDSELSIDESFELGSLTDSPLSGSEIHVYGRDETIAQFRTRAPRGVRVRGHGTGLGVACVSDTDAFDGAAKAIASDVVPFDQRGCLSPRLVLFFGDDAKASDFCVELDRALSEFDERIPRGVLDEAESGDAARYVSTMAYAGRVWCKPSHVVGLAPAGGAVHLPPTGRCVHVLPVSGSVQARSALTRVASFVTAIGSTSQALATGIVDHSVRLSALGQMQHPPLDGPVDLREAAREGEKAVLGE